MIKRITELLLQLIPVAIGVYIGIVAGNWNEQRNHRKNQQELLTNIAKELESNKKKLDRAYTYHHALWEKLDSIFEYAPAEQLDKPFFDNYGFQIIPGWTGVNIPTLETSVFETGIISNLISGMDFETVNRISKIYNYQKQYKEVLRPFTERIINVNNQSTTREMLTALLFLGSDVKEMEKSMSNNMEKMIKDLK